MIKKINIFVVAGYILFFLCTPMRVYAYSVSGLVEFTYQDFEAKTGGKVVSSSKYFTERYQIGIETPILDPRFLRLNAGVDYSVFKYTKGGNDSDLLNYRVAASFFPGRTIAWDLYGNKATSDIQGDGNFAGYHTTITSYGGTLYLRLANSRGGKRNINNNNNNYESNQYYNGRSLFPLPDLTLSHHYTELQTLNLTNPTHETRTNDKASIKYRYYSSMDLNVDGSLEKYENLENRSTYETKTLNAYSTIRSSADSDLNLSGRHTETDAFNIANFAAQETSSEYRIKLNFKEKNNYSHYYEYSFIDRASPAGSYTQQSGAGTMQYRLSQDLRFSGGAQYSQSDYNAKVPAPSQTNIESGSLFGRVDYSKIYRPDFLGPFTFSPSYALDTGYAKVSTTQTAAQSGSGMYYTNNLELRLSSTGWKDDNIQIAYTYYDKHDNTLLNNEIVRQRYQLLINSKRIPKTVIRGSGTYESSDSKTDIANVFIATQQSTHQTQRSLRYNIDITNTPTYYLVFTAGAAHGEATSNLTNSSLSTLVPQSNVVNDDTLIYGSATVNDNITRNLRYAVMLREEYRNTLVSDYYSHNVNIRLDFRMRAILLSLEYRWKEDVPRSGGETTQSSLTYARISRPF